MAENRRGLGRGLSALLGEAEEIAHAVEPADGVRSIPIELVHANPDQPRRHFDPADLAELEQSIRDKGILQPILVRPSPRAGDQYEIVAGERRWRAAQQAGIAVIPALIRTLNDDRAYEISIVENVQREDLNPLEEAQAYGVLITRFGHTQEQIAQAVGKSRSHIANVLRLNLLAEGVRAHVIAGRLSAGHARALLTAEFPERLADLAVTQGLSVRQVEALARTGEARPRKASGPRRTKNADTASLEVDLEDALGMNVAVADHGGAGEVRIKYASLEQLDELCRRLMRR